MFALVAMAASTAAAGATSDARPLSRDAVALAGSTLLAASGVDAAPLGALGDTPDCREAEARVPVRAARGDVRRGDAAVLARVAAREPDAVRDRGLVGTPRVGEGGPTMRSILGSFMSLRTSFLAACRWCWAGGTRAASDQARVSANECSRRHTGTAHGSLLHAARGTLGMLDTTSPRGTEEGWGQRPHSRVGCARAF